MKIECVDGVETVILTKHEKSLMLKTFQLSTAMARHCPAPHNAKALAVSEGLRHLTIQYSACSADEESAEVEADEKSDFEITKMSRIGNVDIATVGRKENNAGE